jgi:hypothetical protein
MGPSRSRPEVGDVERLPGRRARGGDGMCGCECGCKCECECECGCECGLDDFSRQVAVSIGIGSSVSTRPTPLGVSANAVNELAELLNAACPSIVIRCGCRGYAYPIYDDELMVSYSHTGCLSRTHSQIPRFSPSDLDNADWQNDSFAPPLPSPVARRCSGSIERRVNSL